MARATVVALTAVLVLGACTSGQPEAQERPTVRPVSAECRQAFAEVPTEAAELGGAAAPTAAVSPVPTQVAGAFVDLYGTVTACGSVTEWTEASRGERLALTTNADPVTTLRSLCRSSHDEQVRTSPICRELEIPEEVEDVQENDADLDEPTETPGG